MEDELQLEAGQDDVIVDGQEDLTVESDQPTDTDTDISQEQEVKKTGGKKVLVPDYLPHRYERYRKMNESKTQRIADLEAYIQHLDGSKKAIDAYGDDVDKYVTDATTQNTEKILAKRELDSLRSQGSIEREQYVSETWRDRLAEASTTRPDFQEKVAAVADVPVSREVMSYLMQNPYGPEILYHLGENPDIARSLSYMDEANQVRFITQQGAVIQMQQQYNNAANGQYTQPTQPSVQSTVPAPLGKVPNAKPVNNNIDLATWVKQFRGR